jgi:glutaredoxin
MPLPLTMYGATHCEDTQHVRELLTTWLIPFSDINIDHDAVAEQFVIFINGGQRQTPTLVVGNGNRKTILTEPDDNLLKTILLDSGYVPGYQQNHSNEVDHPR